MDEIWEWSTGGIYTDRENPKYSQENLSLMLLCPPQIPLDFMASKETWRNAVILPIHRHWLNDSRSCSENVSLLDSSKQTGVECKAITRGAELKDAFPSLKNSNMHNRHPLPASYIFWRNIQQRLVSTGHRCIPTLKGTVQKFQPFFLKAFCLLRKNNLVSAGLLHLTWIYTPCFNSPNNINALHHVISYIYLFICSFIVHLIIFSSAVLSDTVQTSSEWHALYTGKVRSFWVFDFNFPTYLISRLNVSVLSGSRDSNPDTSIKV
jgi:hypothetical protein